MAACSNKGVKMLNFDRKRLGRCIISLLAPVFGNWFLEKAVHERHKYDRVKR
jgi:hypothetical protein